LIIGAWLAAGAFMDVAAIGNFRAVNRFLADPGVPSAELIHNLGHENTRILLRRTAGESNAWLFEQWEWAQLGIGLSLLLVLLFGNRPPIFLIGLCLLMIAIVLAQRFFLTPVITALGRIIDFLPADPNLPDKKKFWAFHGAYSTVELVKFGLGLVIAGILVIRRQPDPQMFARESEVVEEIPARRPLP
jgi:hypothetical protein